MQVLGALLNRLRGDQNPGNPGGGGGGNTDPPAPNPGTGVNADTFAWRWARITGNWCDKP